MEEDTALKGLWSDIEARGGGYTDLHVGCWSAYG